MSCIAGIINLDGAAVERELLQRMTGAMKRRAPDASDVWCSDNVGFGHAMLRISPESGNEHQPCTLDGQAWITADARIDGRPELIARLRSSGAQVRQDAPDAELILHAYASFGESLLEHLIGDFAFALWDRRRNELFCACDHFGVRPFYYAKTDRAFLFASDIEALLVHPAVSARLDENAIGDFLLLGSYQEAELTVYQDIRRLPAASQICVERDRFRVRRYWQLPPPASVRYRELSEYAEHFRELFELAVIDRLCAGDIALELSGGMDSTSIAAVAAARAKTGDCALTAFTNTANFLLGEDQEGHYAEMAASHLSIPIVMREAGTYPLFERLDSAELDTAEPSPIPYLAFSYDTFADMSRRGARVILSGQGGDEMFAASSGYLAHLLRAGQVGRLAIELLSHLRHTGTLRGMGLRSALMQAAGVQARRVRAPDWRPPFPDWLDTDFALRTQLRDRWEVAWTRMLAATDMEHYVREMCIGQFFSSYEMFKLPLLARHPFVDLRLIEFMLSVPNYIKSDKTVLRKAMQRKLPELVRTRPKTGAAGDFVRAALTRNRVSAPIESSLSSVAKRYVEPGRYMRALARYLGGEGVETTWSSAILVAPICLNYWLSRHSGQRNA